MATIVENALPLMRPRQQVITPMKRVLMLDVSDLYRPEGKDVKDFRIYDEKLISSSAIMRRVYNTYLEMHTKQTVDFVKAEHKKWSQFNHGEWEILDALDLLNNLVDESDPDVDIPNSVHAYQTAERVRELHPNEDWFHLTGLIHDMGKVLALWGEPQFAVVGDTYPVGCLPADSVVFRSSTFATNPDLLDNRYNTTLGMYEKGCGLDNLLMSWGHDEYLYQVLKNCEGCSLPHEALSMIRFHSFYPWHTGGDYWQFASPKDHEMYYWVKEFNKFDLYSKTDASPDVDELKEYYEGLVKKYFKGKVAF